MKLVIDIPEDVYTRIFDNGIQDNEIAADDIREMARSLRLGTPLPKGHGKLKDADEMKRKIGNLDGFGMIGRCIDEFPTIIDSDKTESEDKR